MQKTNATNQPNDLEIIILVDRGIYAVLRQKGGKELSRSKGVLAILEKHGQAMAMQCLLNIAKRNGTI